MSYDPELAPVSDALVAEQLLLTFGEANRLQKAVWAGLWLAHLLVLPQDRLDQSLVDHGFEPIGISTEPPVRH